MMLSFYFLRGFHFDMNSSLLLMHVVGSAIEISSFSVVHKSQRLELQRPGSALAAMHHFMLECFLCFLRSQINLESLVSNLQNCM